MILFSSTLNLLDNKSFLKKIVFWGLTIGVPMNILLVYGKYQDGSAWNIVNFITYALGVVPLAAAYAALIAILVKTERGFLL